MMRRILGVLMAIAAFTTLLNAQTKEPRRGKYLRTEIRKTDRKEDFAFTLVESSASLPCFSFRYKTILTHHEVRIYEMLMEVVRENAGNPSERTLVDYILVPDQVFEGEKSTREEVVDGGPMVNKKISFDNKTVNTDAKGFYFDSRQEIVTKFDDLRVKEVRVVAGCDELGVKNLTITRNMIRREVAKLPGVVVEETPDLLDAFGLDFHQPKQSSPDGVSIKVTAPAQAKAGDIVSITVEVSNAGPKPVGNLLARSFSAEGAISDKMFYFGNIQPGKKVSFMRLVTLPERAGTIFYALGFWSVLGPAPKLEQQLSIITE
ncbi:MAG: hypothetical protein IKP00_08445 [Victivallales bacterium]|nr:hypothetical protein [Victivallales bacterium]